MEQTILIALAALAGLWLVASAAVKITKILAREQTRREVLAYVAEKTISPEEAARLLDMAETADMRQKVLDVAAWDPSWERWRETVRGVITGNDEAPKPHTDHPATAERPA